MMHFSRGKIHLCSRCSDVLNFPLMSWMDGIGCLERIGVFHDYRILDGQMFLNRDGAEAEDVASVADGLQELTNDEAHVGMLDCILITSLICC